MFKRITISIIFLAISLQTAFAQFQLIRKSEEKGIIHYFQNLQEMGGGSAFADINNDGWQDVWINGGSQNEKLYINDGTGSFIDMSMDAGIDAMSISGTTGVIVGDINNDGHRDVFLISSAGTHNYLLYNNGDGSFTDISLEAGILQDTSFSMSASFADINLDGYLDIYVGNYISEINLLYDNNGVAIGFDHTCSEDYLYLNNQDNTFQKLGADFWENQEGCVLASTFTDYDLDGDQDLMIANDFGEWITPNKLFNNNYPENSLSEMSTALGMNVGIYAMGIAIGDYDLDEDLDYYVTNLGRNVLLNNDDGLFLDKTEYAGVEDIKFQDLNTVGWGTSFQDMDLDMYPDLLVANGYIPAGGGSLDWLASNPNNPNKLYLNNQDGTFEDASTATGFSDKSKARGLAAADIDNDGDVDVMVVHVNALILPGEEIRVALYENTLSSNHNWVKLSLEGVKSNRDALGSVVKLYSGGNVLIRELNGGSSHVSQNSSVLHFGLADNSQVDSINVFWPGGAKQTIIDPAINTTVHVVEDLNIYTAIEDQMVENHFVFPIPAQEYLFLSNYTDRAEFVVIDQLGKKKFSGIGNRVALKGLATGLYFVQVVQNKKLKSFPFVKL